MKGLTPTQLIEITEFVQKHHKFAYVPDEDRINGQLGYCIKYIDACYDSRQSDYWAITFRGSGRAIFTTNAFGPFNEAPKDFVFTNLYDWIMAFLRYEWEPKGRDYKFMSGEKDVPLHNSFPNGIIEREWSDIDMINAYCGDLEDGVSSDDMAMAAKWVIEYRKTLHNKPAQSSADERSVATEAK